MSDVVWLSYDEISDRLGIRRESARQHVIRKRWGRRKGNDGKTRVGVPEEALQARTIDDTPPATPLEASDDTSDDTHHDPSPVTVLTRHIERLEKQLDALTTKLACVEAERDFERQKASELAVQAATTDSLKVTVEALKAALETEKQRSADLRDDRDRWQRTAIAPRGIFSWFRQSA